MSKIPDVYVYLRVSTDRQDISNQEAEIIRYCGANDYKITEIVKDDGKSGTISWKKRKIFDIIQKCRKGDIVIVPELSRIGRKMLEIMEILSICSDKHVKIIAVKGNYESNDSLSSKIVAMGYSISAEIERNLISERTKAALQKRKDDGVKLGLPKGCILSNNKLHSCRDDIVSKYFNGVSKKDLADQYSVSCSYMSRFVNNSIKLISVAV